MTNPTPDTPTKPAPLQFEPWPDKNRQEASLRANTKDGLQLAGMLIPYCYGLMFKTKAELAAEIEEWDEERGRLIMEGFLATHDFLKAATTLVNGAEARILIAGGAFEEETQA